MSECKHETWNSVSSGLKWACGECGKFESDVVDELRQQLTEEQAKRIAWELNAERAEDTIAAMRSALEELVERYIANRGTKYEFVSCITPEGIPDYWERAKQALSNTANTEYPVKMVKRRIQAGRTIFNQMGEVIPGAYQAFTKHVEVHLPYCGQCGKVIDDIGQKYCGWCGVRINTDVQAALGEDKQP